jgi:hypothetical protein
MAFAEDLSLFTATAGFGVAATVAGAAANIIFDAPGAEALDGQVVTTEPSALIPASIAVAVGASLVLSGANLPAQLAHHAGTYTVRSVIPEPPDGVFERAFLAKVS